MTFEEGKRIKVTLFAKIKKVLDDSKLLVHLDDGETILVWANECEEIQKKETTLTEEEELLREMNAK